MTNTKNTKRALLSSVMALFLCFAMLLGTTYAWFTDSVTSAGNKIMSGTLKVDLELLDKESNTWNSIKEDKTALFDYDKWEPGYTEVKMLKVENEGTLALKWKAKFVSNEELGILADVIDVYVLAYGVLDDATGVTYPADRNLDGYTKVGTLREFVNTIESTTYGNLEAGEAAYLGIALKMQETAGNEYQDKKLGAFDIMILATQLTSEDDSFGNDYDANAEYVVEVATVDALKAALATVQDGDVIKLTADMTFTGDNCYVLNGYNEGIYYEGDKSFTIDLNGQTITNDSAINDYLMLFKNCGEKANTITLKNGKIEANSTPYSAVNTSGGSTQQITINLEDVEVSNTRTDGYGDVVRVRGGAVANVNEGAVITGKGVYVTLYSVNATVNIYEGAEIYMDETTSYVGSVVGASNGGTVNAYGGYGKGTQGCFIAMTTGGTINVEGGEWIADCNGTGNDGNYSVLIAQNSTYETYWASKSIINVTGGTFSGKYNCYGVAAGDSVIDISGGTFNADPASYLAKGYEATESNGTWTVAMKEHTVSSADELAAAIAEGGKVTLTQDVEIASSLSIVADTVIDGNGETLTYTGANRAIEIANNADYDVDVTIKNLTVDCSASYCQRGINYNDNGTLTLENVTVKGDNVTYGINLPGKSTGATVIINGGSYSACIPLNIWGENSVIVANDVDFITVDNADTEGYACISLNNDGTISAEGALITINGGSITVTGSNTNGSYAVRNETLTGKVTVSEDTEVTGTIVEGFVSVVRYNGTDNLYAHTSLQNSVKCVEKYNSGWVVLLTDITVDSLEVNGDVSIDTNGHTLTVGSYTGSGKLTVDGTVVYGN